ncbi:hypothetical protein H6P81_001864 [Aristolochia fimbriata]|uniref:Uncharacterized protein n=1 Tax=Aristolochia fimbriata TaxID=158543 RepID=A0AAV7F990_ARIFI|nr:hypothetical protein H6P81_001864 [Aristolochia fimbriata]
MVRGRKVEKWKAKIRSATHRPYMQDGGTASQPTGRRAHFSNESGVLGLQSRTRTRPGKDGDGVTRVVCEVVTCHVLSPTQHSMGGVIPLPPRRPVTSTLQHCDRSTGPIGFLFFCMGADKIAKEPPGKLLRIGGCRHRSGSAAAAGPRRWPPHPGGSFAAFPIPRGVAA